MHHNDRRIPDGTTNRPYVERRLQSERFEPALRQALMAAEPAFFGWDASRQDRYRREMPDSAREQLEQRLETAIVGSHGPAWHPFDAANAVNALTLPLFGIGEDCFWLNEHGKGWYDMDTVADLSHDHYRSDPDREENRLPFMGQFFPSWCRYLRRGHLVYATLTAFHHYVADEVARRHDELVDQLIPYRLVEGKDHGKKTKGGYIWNMERDAGGLEGQLDAPLQRSWTIQGDLYLQALGDCHARSSGQVFRVVSSDGADPMTSWVFDGLDAMRGVRLTHFLADVQARRGSRRLLAGLVAPYCNEGDALLRQAHDDIMRSWDPKLARFKRKRQVLLSDQAASDLLDD